MPNVRSGSHLEQIGSTWYYRRVVPSDVRDVFGTTKVKKSLGTSSEVEAKRLEKIKDVEFEEKLQRARQTGPDGYSRDRETRIDQFADKVLNAHVTEGVDLDEALQTVPEGDRAAVDRWIDDLATVDEKRDEDLKLLWADLEGVIYGTDNWENVRPGIVAAVKDYVQGLNVEHTLDWAYVQWSKSANRPQQTLDEASRYLDDFKRSAHVRVLAGVRRVHLTGWRGELELRGTPKAVTAELRAVRKLSTKSVNHRLEIVSAILRTGWRDAEMLAPDLQKINLPEDSTNDRGAWSKEQLLKVLGLLEPKSGQAWLFVLGLTTSTRMGETVAARKEWYNPLGFIEVPAEYTKMKKPHVMPIIELIRAPLVKHIGRLKAGEYMFDVPRPTNPDLKISHEASKWFSRFRTHHGVKKVIHELRDTWIDEARHNNIILKDIWEIITAHSGKTGSDGYGGQRPAVLMEANETICGLLLDAELRAAILRLVG